MIAKIILIAILGVVICRDISESEVTVAFGNFMAEYNKHYDTIEETIMRYNIFADNYRYIENHNMENTDFELAVNQFADLTPEEFKFKFLNNPRGEGYDNPCRLPHVKKGTDTKIDWRKKNAVSSVKNQGSCGSCWAFSTVGALEGLYAINKGSILEFSEQELVDCTRSYGNEGCQGGWMSWAFEYIREKGISTRKEYPYEGRNGPCRKKSNSFQIKGCINVTKDDSDSLLEALNINPVSICVRANNREFMYYRRGIIKTGCGTPKAELDHGITLVGADFEGSDAFWIAKNSWGSGWGESGYVRIKRDTGKGQGICGIAMDNCYPSL